MDCVSAWFSVAELFLCSEMQRGGTAQFDPGRIFDFVDIMGEHLIVSSVVWWLLHLAFESFLDQRRTTMNSVLWGPY